MDYHLTRATSEEAVRAASSQVHGRQLADIRRNHFRGFQLGKTIKIDPCLACSVQVPDARSNGRGVFRVCDVPKEEVAGSMTDSQEYSGRIVVLGLGNMLLKDEGIGLHVVHALQRQDLPANVELIDGGTSSLDVLLLQECPYKLVVVDAMKAGKKPGTIYKTRFESQQIQELEHTFSKKKNSTLSLHQVGLVDALLVAQKTECGPDEVTIIGVEPNEIEGGLELTEPVSERMPQIINSVLEEIEGAFH